MSDITENDIPVNIEDIMHTAYLQYSLSVNVGRAIPDVRDGLKPGNRRILYAMRQLGLTKSHAYTKSAKVVGEVIGNYHPHGDASVYDTMVRMAQDFAMRHPLIDGQGNFGSIDGDPAAAYRYTECRMERLAEELLADIAKNTVNMIPTFDESNLEPEVLPARFPNLLVNGSTGIGVGMATNIPPHNLGEIIDATVLLLEHPTASVTDLMEHVKGPDFPTGATIRGRGEIHRLYETGRGVIKIRSKAEIVEKNGRETIIVTEIPYAVNKENMVKKIAALINEKKITGISDLRDETSRRVGIRVVIEIKKAAMAQVVLNQLYAHCQLENIFACSMLVVDHNRPKVMNLKQLLQAYIDHRMEVVTRRTKFDLEKAEARAHILEGLLIAVKNIDAVVKIIRESRDRELAAVALRERFGLSLLQANAILDMRLHQLTGLAIDDLQKEYDELLKLIEYLKSLLDSREKRVQVIKTELLEVKEKYGEPRRTNIEHDDSDFSVADLIARHACVITISNTGYIKRVPADTFRTQHRGGKGVIGMDTKDEDYVEHLFIADSHDLIFFYTEKGNMHWLNVYEIPEGTRESRGKAVVNLLKIEPGEQLRAMLTVKRDDVERADLFILMATRRGVVKKTRLCEFKNLRRVGIRAITIEEGDDLIGAAVTNNAYEVILSSSKGMACRFHEADIRPTGRSSRGVTGIRFKIEGDSVVSMLAIESDFRPEPPPLAEGEEAPELPEVEEPEVPETEDGEEEEVADGPQILVITDGGMGKRSFVKAYRKTRRGAKGVVNIRLKEGETVISALEVEDGDEIIITTKEGQITRMPTDEVRAVGRASQGVRIMRFRKDDDTIASVAKLVEVGLEKKVGQIEGELLPEELGDSGVEPEPELELEPPAVDDAPETTEGE